jgi:large subunit ribosomal protein L4
VPKKVYRAALQSALSAKVSSGEVVVLSDVSLPELKTQRLAQMLMRLGLSGKTLMVVGGEYQELERPARNLKNLKLVRVNELNVYDLVWCEKLAIIRSQLSVIQEFWS